MFGKMFAVVKTGGKQYCVKPGDVIKVEKLNHKENEKVVLDNVILVSTENETIFGTPNIANAKVEASVLKQKRNEKIIVFKKIRRHNYRRKNGHRQHMTVLKISNIVV